MAPFDHDHYRKLMRSKWIGREVRYFEETGSTMDEARAGADATGVASNGIAYVAGRQTAGRGRHGRQWVSEPGAGLYVTYHLTPAVADGSSLYAVAGAMAVADAVREVARLDTVLKWPNDVLHATAGGSSPASSPRRATADAWTCSSASASTCGLRRCPPRSADIATSIEDAGGDVPRIEELLAALSHALEPRIAEAERAPEILLEEWKRRLVTLGQRVRLASPDGAVHEGEAVDVSPRGDLVLRHDDGTVSEYAAGDVTTV